MNDLYFFNFYFLQEITFAFYFYPRQNFFFIQNHILSFDTRRYLNVNSTRNLNAVIWTSKQRNVRTGLKICFTLILDLKYLKSTF